MSAAIPGGLLPLRQEIGIFAGPAALDGSPTWTLHDPARNRFYRIGWMEFEILSRWESGSIDTITDRIAHETTLQVDREDVEQVGRFLSGFDLLHAATPQATAALLQKAARLRQNWGTWLLHNYLFMRFPLFRPDGFLTATYPLVRWAFSPAFALIIVELGLLGLYLVGRQWDAFVATFVDFFTLEGLIGFAVTLACLKVVHELGHAYTAKHYGCRVPSAGLALLVLVPVLYTDQNDAWKLTARRQRLAIGLAGVTAEFCCAAVALCVWGFLPSGPARSVAFLVATSTWLTTVLINASPFMRFDGYYVLSDWLETPNLHARAFALAQGWLREVLIGFGDPPPEELPAGRQRLLIAFAFLTWAYRLVLFLGIAALIYHFTFKVAGIAMAAVEIGYFVVWPVASEVRIWWRRRADMRLNPHTISTATVLALLAALVMVPWRSAIDAPALFKSAQHVDVFVPDFGARVAAVNASNQQTVDAGRVLVRLASPDLDYRLSRLRTDIEVLEWQMAARGLDSTLLARSQITEQEYQAARAEYRSLLDQQRKLNVAAPIGGMVVDVAEDLKPGLWVAAKSRLLSVIEPHATTVEAYIDESDLHRIAIGNAATFFAEADSRIEIPLRIAEIARASTRMLTEPYLVSSFGGPITGRAPKQNEFVPDHTLYQVRLIPTVGDASVRPERVLRGRVTLRGEPTSLARRAWRAVLAIVIRESGV
jgi:putative peptide zinc metalloprotease protein